MIPPILEFCRVDRTTIRLHRILALLTYFVFACAGRAQVLTCGTAYWKFGYVGTPWWMVQSGSGSSSEWSQA
jgi:hypothetical protein